jgi:hypothetical protein
MLKLFLKLIIAILSIPIGVGVTEAFYKNLTMVSALSGKLPFFLWGIAAYVVIHLLFYKPTYLYVLGHEAVHAGISWIFGGKIKSFKVSKAGGSVGTDKSNVVISLSPYFVPIYAIVIAVIYFVVASSYNINGATFIFLIGFALAFHMISTIEVMKIRQPDIVKSGHFFSIVFVYVFNVIVVALIFSLMFPEFFMKKFFVDSWLLSKGAYVGAARQMFM